MAFNGGNRNKRYDRMHFGRVKHRVGKYPWADDRIMTCESKHSARRSQLDRMYASVPMEARSEMVHAYKAKESGPLMAINAFERNRHPE